MTRTRQAPTYTADVLVVGGGGSGLAAAISAATSGASVIVLEKVDHVGGSTGLSVGSFTAANTSYQFRAGVNDSVEAFVEDMRTANGEFEERENTELREILAQNAAGTLEWLGSLGVQFLGPTPEPPYEKPRMHNVLPNSRSYVYALEKEARRHDIRILTSMRVDKLLRNASGDVIGARVGSARYIGRRGVVLATGDYSASEELKREFVGPDAAKVPPVNPHNTGDGFALGTDVGGVVLQMDRLYEDLRFAPSGRRDLIKSLPPVPALARAMRWGVERLPTSVISPFIRGALTSWVGPNISMYHAGAVLVGDGGERLVAESTPKDIARAVAATPSNVGYMVFDSAVADRFSAWPHPASTFPGVAYAYVQDYKRFRPDMYHRADTVEALARSIGVPADRLVDTVDRWNRSVDAGRDLDFGRENLGEGVRSGPFYALGPMNAYITLADGGLAVDSRLRVTDRVGRPIPGLWAAGSTGQGGLQLLNHGLHIGWAMVSGRLVGRHVAAAPERSDLQAVEALDAPAAQLPTPADQPG
ncbi:Fumarate reductase flavoprotein subunit [Actinomycetales bacterium JB111]|nr:Fumarate reductase flavoprotein subunit [Actinomycetales bacterium JB111]